MNDSNSCLGKTASCATIIGTAFALISAAIAVFTFLDYNPFISNKSNQQGIGPSRYAPFPQVDSRLFTIENASFKMIRVEGGTFLMGAREIDSDAYENEKPIHQVTLSSYYIGETEVTQALWEAVMKEKPKSHFNGLNRPVECVSWDDCQEFIKELNAATKKEFRLPTEAEWEYAARGGNRSREFKFSGSDTLGDVAWYADNSGLTTHNVAMKQSNELGLYDMSGNVNEWCSDWYGSYSNESLTNPMVANSGQYHVERGGDFHCDIKGCRLPDRNKSLHNRRNSLIGLRLALSE